MKFDVSKKARTAEKNTVSPSFFVEGEQLQKREEPLDVPSFMHRAPAGAKPSGTTVQKDAEKQRRAADQAVHTEKRRKRKASPAAHPGRTNKAHTKGRRKRRRGSRLLYYLMFAVLGFTVLFILCITVFFRIDTIRVEGDDTVDQNAIIAQSGIQMGDNLWRTNTSAAAERILSSHIEYDRVEVERSLPSGIVIRLVPSKIEAVCFYEGQYYSISEGGRIIAVSDQAPADTSLPLVYGCVLQEAEYGDVLIQNDTNRLAALQTVMDAIAENELTGVTHIDLSDLSTIRIYWQNRAELKFGGLDGLSYEIGCVKKLLENNVAEDEIVVIDDTLMNGTYYKRPVEALTLPGSSAKNGESSSPESENTQEGATSSKPADSEQEGT